MSSMLPASRASPRTHAQIAFPYSVDAHHSRMGAVKVGTRISTYRKYNMRCEARTALKVGLLLLVAWICLTTLEKRRAQHSEAQHSLSEPKFSIAAAYSSPIKFTPNRAPYTNSAFVIASAFAQQQHNDEPQALDVWLADGTTPFNGLLYVRASSQSPNSSNNSPATTTTTTISAGEGGVYRVPSEGWTMAIAARYRAGNEVANVVCSQLGLGRSPASTIIASHPIMNSYPVYSRPIPAGPIDVNCANESARNGPTTSFTRFEPRLSLSRCTYGPPPKPPRIPKNRWRPPFVQNEDAENGDWWEGEPRPPGSSAPSASDDCWLEAGSYVQCEPPPALWEFKLVNQTEGIPTRGLVMMRPTRLPIVQPSTGDVGVPQPPLPWGTVHYAFFLHSPLACRFICHALGFPSARSPAVLSTEQGTNPYGTADPTIAPSYLAMQLCPPDATSFNGCTQYTFSSRWDRFGQLAIQCDDEVDTKLSAITAVKFLNGWSPSSGQIYVQTPATGTASWLYIPARVLLEGSPKPPYDANVTKLSHNINALRALCAAAGFPNAKAPAFRFVGRALAMPTAKSVPFQQMICLDDAGSDDGSGGSPYNFSRHCRFLRSSDDMSGDNMLPAGLDCFPDNFSGDSTSTSFSNSSYSGPDGGPLQQWEFKLTNSTKFSQTTGAPIDGVVMMRPNINAPWGLISSPQDDNYGLHQAVCGTLGFNLDTTVAIATRNLNPFFRNAINYESQPNVRLIVGAPTYLEIVSCPHPLYLSNTSNNRRPQITSVQDECTYSPVGSALEGTSKILAIDCDASNGRGSEGILNASKFLVGRSVRGFDYITVAINSETRPANVCSDDKNALAVLCRAMGYKTATAETVSIRGYAMFPNIQNSLINLRCPPSPTATLSDCSYEAVLAEKCPAYSVHCLLPNLPSIGFAFRLVGGPTPASGRLQIRPSPDHPWGAVSSLGWTSVKDRHMLVAVCAAMGFTDPSRPQHRPLTQAAMAAEFGDVRADVPVWLDSISCQPQQTENFNSFIECIKTHLGTVEQSHANDLAINCEGPPLPPNSDRFEFRATFVGTSGLIRLHRIEMRENSTAEWGRIHQNNFESRTVDAACRSVGMLAASPNDTKPTNFYDQSMYKNHSIPSKISSFACGHRAMTLHECEYDPSSFLNGDFDAIWSDFIVDCAPQSDDPKVYRLANGTAPWEGRLEVRLTPSEPWRAMIEAFRGDHWPTVYYNEFFATPIAVCRTVGFPYIYNPTRYGYLHAPPRVLPHGSFGGADTNDTSTHAPMRIFYSTDGAYGERIFNCAKQFIDVPSAGITYDPALTLSFDCEAKLYDLATTEFRLNFTFSSTSPYSTFGLVEMRPSAEAGWGTVNTLEKIPVTDLVAVNLCRAINGAVGPANYAAQMTLGMSSMIDTAAGRIPLHTSLNTKKHPIHAFDWYCPPEGGNQLGIRGCSSGILPDDAQVATTSVHRHDFDLLLDCNAVPQANVNRKWRYRLTQNNVDTTAEGIGIFEVRPYEGGQWGTLCGDYTHLPFPALQACRGLGFDPLAAPEGFVAGPPSAFSTAADVAPFKTAVGSADQYAAMPVWFSNINCPPDVSLLSKCVNRFIPLGSTGTACMSHGLDVALDCNAHLYKISEFEFRAVQVFQGFASIVRLEVRPSASAPWGTVYEHSMRETVPSADQRIANIAKTLCAFAGFLDPSRASSVIVNNFGSGPVWLSDPNCTDAATGQPVGSGHPSGCRFSKETMGAYTDHTYDLAVDCLYVPIDDPITDVSAISFRLNEATGHATRNYERGFGRVEAKPTPYAEWGTVGNYGFTSAQAPALCRSMGYLSPDPANAQMVAPQYPLAAGRQWLSIPAYQCPSMLSTNTSTRISDCSGAVWASTVRLQTFTHTSDLWLECYPQPTISADSCVGVSHTAEFSASATVTPTAPSRPTASAAITATLPFRPTLRPIPAPPQAVLTAQNMADTVGVAISAVSIASATGGQLGVANAMARLAKCGSEEPFGGHKEGSGKNEEEEEDVPILIHPLRFSVWGGQGNPLGRYFAASLSNMFIIPLVAGLIARFIIPRAIIFADGLWGAAARGRVRRRGAPQAVSVGNNQVCQRLHEVAPFDDSDGARGVGFERREGEAVDGDNISAAHAAAEGGGMTMEEALTTVGWPFVVAMPIVTLAEGTGVAIVKSLSSGSFVGVAFGLMGLICLAAFAAVWVRALAVIIPRRRLALRAPNNGARSNATGTERGEGARRANRSILGTDSNDDADTEMLALALGHNAAGDAPTTTDETFSLSFMPPPDAPTESINRSNPNNCSRWFAFLVSPTLEWVPADDPVDGDRREEKNNEHELTSSLEQPFLQRSGGNESGGPQQPHGGADDRRTNTEAGDISPDYQPQVKQRTRGPRVTHDIIERFSNALGDKRWYYAEILSFGCSLLVGAMEGIPDEHCQPRAVVAAIATILQCGLSCLTVVPLELCLQLLLSVCVVPMALIVVARVFDASTRGGEGSDALEVATAVLITAANLFGIALLVLAVAIGVKETLTSREGSRRAHVLRFEHRSATTGEYPSGGGGARCPNETSQVETIEHRHQQQQVSTPPTGIPAAFIEGDGRGLLFEDGDDNGAVDILPLARSSSSSSLLSLPGPAIEETVTVPPNPSLNQARLLPVGKGAKRKGKAATPTERERGDAETPETTQRATRVRGTMGLGLHESTHYTPYDDGPMPPSFEGFNGPRWQAELLYRVEQAAKARDRAASTDGVQTV